MKNSGVVKLYDKSGEVIFYRRYKSKYDRNIIVKKLLIKYRHVSRSFLLCYCPDEPDMKDIKGFVTIFIIEGSGLAEEQTLIADFEYSSTNERFSKIKSVYEQHKLWTKKYHVNINPII